MRTDFIGAGVRLAADTAGDPSDPAVLLLHGGGQTRHSWHTTLANVAANGWYAVAMDHRGHGDSEWAPDGDYTLDAFASDVIAVASTLRSPVLVGASLGGTSSLAALGRTRADPVGRALVLVDVAPQIETAGAARIGGFMREHAESGFASLDEVADAVQSYNPHRPRPQDLSGLQKNVRRHADGRWYWHWDPRFLDFGDSDEPRVRLHQGEMLEDAARSLRVPAMIVRGLQSDLLSEEGAQRYIELVPHARFVEVSGAGHMVAGDRNDVFNDAVVDFLDDVRNGTAPVSSDVHDRLGG